MTFSSSLPIPVTLLTGALGAGKTTLLNRLLTADHGRHIAAIVNEFGEIGIDGDLIVNVEDEGIYTLSNGCICCAIREDLVEVIEGLVHGGGDFDQIVIETTGLAEPGPVVMGLLNHPEIEETFRLDGIVTVADARHLMMQLSSGPETQAQIAYADRILLNKIDLVEEDDLTMVEREIRTINPLAPIIRTVRGEVDPYELLEIGGFTAGGDIATLNERHAATASSPHVAHGGNRPEAVSMQIDGTIDRERFDAWIAPLLERHHRDIYRVKGILHVADAPAPLVVQGVHGLYTWGFAPLRNDIPGCRLVFIGRNLDRAELEAGIAGCITPSSQQQ